MLKTPLSRVGDTKDPVRSCSNSYPSGFDFDPDAPERAVNIFYRADHHSLHAGRSGSLDILGPVVEEEDLSGSETHTTGNKLEGIRIGLSGPEVR